MAVLEGFSFAVAIIIGVGQFNSALGLVKHDTMKAYPELHNNVIETFSYIGDAKPADYGAFIFFFLLLFLLTLLPPPHHKNADGTKGKPKAKLPWLAIVSVIGLIYGFICSYFELNIKPKLLLDAYPATTTDPLFNFSYYNDEKVTMDLMGPVIFASIKVAIVAISETLISAMVA